MFSHVNPNLLPHLDPQLLPNLKAHQTRNSTSKQAREPDSVSSSGGSLCSWSSSSSSSSSSNSSSRENHEEIKIKPVEREHRQSDCIKLFSVPPPLVNNSALVRQRAKDQLAAASIATGASLPLMLGGRSRCVVNLLSDDAESPEPGKPNYQEDDQPIDRMPRKSASPKNTARRAEQRRQNMSVSVVRPVVSNPAPFPEPEPASQKPSSGPEVTGQRFKPDDSSLWPTGPHRTSSIIDDFMALDNSRLLSRSSTSEQLMQSDLLLLGNRFDASLAFNHPRAVADDELVEQQARHQLLLFKREELELNRGIRRQHRFVVAKLEERRRGLQIVHSVWVQRNFRHAIEKLVDLYHQGLIFTDTSTSRASQLKSGPQNGATLSSLNTPIVVDVISVIILRPKLWNLDVCRLLLPILINDLLLVFQNHQQTRIASRSPEEDSMHYEYYTEVALKALKLIMNQFGSVIKSTLDSERDVKRLLAGGVDLSREERVNKCLDCRKLLIEAQQVVAKGLTSSGNRHNKLASLYREIQQSFEALQLRSSPAEESKLRSRSSANVQPCNSHPRG